MLRKGIVLIMIMFSMFLISCSLFKDKSHEEKESIGKTGDKQTEQQIDNIKDLLGESGVKNSVEQIRYSIDYPGYLSNYMYEASYIRNLYENDQKKLNGIDNIKMSIKMMCMGYYYISDITCSPRYKDSLKNVFQNMNNYFEETDYVRLLNILDNNIINNCNIQDDIDFYDIILLEKIQLLSTSCYTDDINNFQTFFTGVQNSIKKIELNKSNINKQYLFDDSPYLSIVKDYYKMKFGEFIGSFNEQKINNFILDTIKANLVKNKVKYGKYQSDLLGIFNQKDLEGLKIDINDKYKNILNKYKLSDYGLTYTGSKSLIKYIGELDNNAKKFKENVFDKNNQFTKDFNKLEIMVIVYSYLSQDFLQFYYNNNDFDLEPRQGIIELMFLYYHD